MAICKWQTKLRLARAQLSCQVRTAAKFHLLCGREGEDAEIEIEWRWGVCQANEGCYKIPNENVVILCIELRLFDGAAAVRPK